ncbi:hypothetical protein CDAR_37671 [Caerostris darwini]|uniref:Uncharacterized protein n=1 Tax=Caerostris darwini TaxID=1538125 RepID=A0AAV4V7J4_9ARAC|nr:hypothetical protein CDAR_37671 [Caerostris darwini]
MLITFFDSRGIIHRGFRRQGFIVTGAFYKDLLDRRLKRIRNVNPVCWSVEIGDSCTSMKRHTKPFLSSNFCRKGRFCASTTPILTRSVLPVYFLFPKLKLKIKGQWYE